MKSGPLLWNLNQRFELAASCLDKRQGFFKTGVAKQIWIGRRTLLPAASSSLSDLPLAGLTAEENEERST
jgi:ABC-type Na+ transport system ATPase subunit NatA